jgi:hypothetical protein
VAGDAVIGKVGGEVSVILMVWNASSRVAVNLFPHKELIDNVPMGF